MSCLQDLVVYPLLDIDKALRAFGQDRALAYDVFKSLVEDEIPGDLRLIAEARAKNEWGTVVEFVHKIKGGAMYCGITRLQHACLLFENYKKFDDIEQLNFMLEQVLLVCAETQEKIRGWLADNKEFFNQEI